MFATAVGVRGFNTLPDVLMFGAAGPLEHLLVFSTVPEGELTANPAWPLIPGETHVVSEDTIWLGGYQGNLNRMRLWTDVLTGSTATP